jgi:hypothetical protein
MAGLFAMSVNGVAVAADAAKMDAKSMQATAEGDYKAAKAKIKGDSEAAEAQCKKMTGRKEDLQEGRGSQGEGCQSRRQGRVRKSQGRCQGDEEIVITAW